MRLTLCLKYPERNNRCPNLKKAQLWKHGTRNQQQRFWEVCCGAVLLLFVNVCQSKMLCLQRC